MNTKQTYTNLVELLLVLVSLLGLVFCLQSALKDMARSKATSMQKECCLEVADETDSHQHTDERAVESCSIVANSPQPFWPKFNLYPAATPMHTAGQLLPAPLYSRQEGQRVTVADLPADLHILFRCLRL